MKFLLNYFKKYKLYTFIVILLYIIRAGLEIFIPFLLGNFINLLISQLGNNKLNQDLYLTFFYIVLISIITLLTVIVSSYFESRLNTNILYDMRKDLYKKVSSLSKNNIDKLTVSSLISRQTQDLEKIYNFISFNMKMIILQPLFLIGYLIMSFFLSVPLTLHLFVIVVFLISISIFNILVRRKYTPKLRKIEDDINLKTREHVSGVRVIKAFNKEKIQEDRQETNLNLYNKYNLILNKLDSFYNQVFVFFQGFVILFLTFIAVNYNYLKPDGFNPGNLFTLTQYSGRTLFSFIFFIMTAYQIPDLKVRIKRIKEVYSEENLVKYKEYPNDLISDKYEIRFENVEYFVKDAEKAIINNINFTLKEGETLAIIGLIGSGKSTILNLLKRYFDPTSGNIYINNIDLKHIKKEELSNLISISPQTSNLFKGSIRENLSFSNPNLTEEEMINSLKMAQAYDFVFEKDNNLDYLINQGGMNLSGGQRQRLSIARVLSSKAKIYLFDDSFSALDMITDKKIRNNLKNNKASKIIVAQRINTIIDADKILVLNSGEQVGYGTHEELIKNCQLYKEIAISQNFIKKEEAYEK